MKKKTKIFIITTLVSIVLAAGYFFIYQYAESIFSKLNKTEVFDEKEIINEDLIISKQANKAVNILLIGADNLEYEIGRENSWIQERSDVIKIISLDYTSKKIKVISLDRDVIEYFPLEGYEDYYRFNWAYSWGKSKLAIATTNYNLDLDITKYVSMSFAGFISIIDKIGGIDVELNQTEVDAFNDIDNSKVTMKKKATVGINHLDGYDALAYARIREIDSDYNRMQRQNEIIKKTIDKLKDKSYTELISIASEILPYISTNLTIDEIKSYLYDIISFNLNEIETTSYPEKLDETYVYWNYVTNMGGYVLSDYESEISKIHSFIYEVNDYQVSKSLIDKIEKLYEKYPKTKEGKPSGV